MTVVYSHSLMWSHCVAVLKCVRLGYKYITCDTIYYPTLLQDWNILALDGSNWQTMDLFDFQTAIEVV